MRRIAIFRLYARLAWIRAMLWMSMFGRSVEPTPEAYLYVADLHFQLASEYESIRHWRQARRHRKRAEWYAVQGPPPDRPPRAAAMAMPVPQPPIFTDARGFRYDPPDGAA